MTFRAWWSIEARGSRARPPVHGDAGAEITFTRASGKPGKALAAEYPPFMFGYGVLPAVVARIQDCAPPEFFSHDYLRHTLGFYRESDRGFIPLVKRIGVLSAEGKPTELYHRLRDRSQAAGAVAAAMKQGYPMFYAKHADAHELDREALAALVAELTGLAPGHTNARAIVGTFFALKTLASPRGEAERVVIRRAEVERRDGR